MANVSYTNLNLARLGNAALESFVKGLLPISQFSTNYSPEALGRATGNVVLVPLVGTLTAQTFAGTYAVCGGTKSVVTVTMNRHQFVPVGQRDLDALDNSDSALESFFHQQGAALAQGVVEDILSIVTTSNFQLATAVASNAVDVPQLRVARLKLNQQNTPAAPRIGIIDSAGIDALLAVTNFVQAQMFYDNGVLRDGRVMRALGFDLAEVNGSFKNSTWSVNGFFAHPQAIAVAMRYVAPQKPDAYQFAQQFSDPQTGITVGMRDAYDPLTGNRYISLECNYGYSAGITYGGTILKRTD